MRLDEIINLKQRVESAGKAIYHAQIHNPGAPAHIKALLDLADTVLERVLDHIDKLEPEDL